MVPDKLTPHYPRCEAQPEGEPCICDEIEDERSLTEHGGEA